MNGEHSQIRTGLALSIPAGSLLVVGIYTNSLGSLSEALHSRLDLLAAAMTLPSGSLPVLRMPGILMGM